MNSQPYSFTTGDTDPVGDCGKFEAGINVDDWLQRIVVYGDTPADAEALRDQLMAEPLDLRNALNHIIKTVGQSRTQTRRLRWISKRAELALEGRPYVAAEHELPVSAESEHFKLLRKTGRLNDKIEALQQRLTVQDQREDDLKELLSIARQYIRDLASSLENACEFFEGNEEDDPQADEECEEARRFAMRIEAALNPTAEAESQ